MPARLTLLAVLVLVPISLAACGKREEPANDALASKLDALDRRLGAVDQRLQDMEKRLPPADRLQNDVRLLEQRLTGAEAKATQALETAKAAPVLPPVAATGPTGSTRPGNRPDMLERRTALAGLMSEYRRKLADLSKQQGANVDPMERSAARRELRAWYIARRRAILTGQPVPEPPTP
jgi:hypothetical protein